MDILMEDLPYELHAMVEIIGIKQFEEISKLYGGTTVYIPVHRKLQDNIMEKILLILEKSTV